MARRSPVQAPGLGATTATRLIGSVHLGYIVVSCGSLCAAETTPAGDKESRYRSGWR
jgi:hypothetical protein